MAFITLGHVVTDTDVRCPNCGLIHKVDFLEGTTYSDKDYRPTDRDWSVPADFGKRIAVKSV